MEKKQLNIVIRADILEDFKQACNDYNLKMSGVIEHLLDDFNKGNYSINISRDSGMEITRKK